MDDGTLNVLDLKTASFFVGRTPIGPIIGNYEISSMIPSLGGSGTGVGTIVEGPPGTLMLTAQGFSAGFTSSFTASGVLHEKGGMTWTLQGDLFGTTIEGTVEVGPAGGITGTINVLAIGPFIESITILGGSISDGVVQATDIVSYTDGTEGFETITATHQWCIGSHRPADLFLAGLART